MRAAMIITPLHAGLLINAIACDLVCARSYVP